MTLPPQPRRWFGSPYRFQTLAEDDHFPAPSQAEKRAKHDHVKSVFLQVTKSWIIWTCEAGFNVLLLISGHVVCGILKMFPNQGEACPTFWRLLMSVVARDGSPGPLEINRPSYSILIKSWFQGTKWTSAPLCKHTHACAHKHTHTQMDRHVIKLVLRQKNSLRQRQKLLECNRLCFPWTHRSDTGWI